MTYKININLHKIDVKEGHDTECLFNLKHRSDLTIKDIKNMYTGPALRLCVWTAAYAHLALVPFLPRPTAPALASALAGAPKAPGAPGVPAGPRGVPAGPPPAPDGPGWLGLAGDREPSTVRVERPGRCASIDKLDFYL